MWGLAFPLDLQLFLPVCSPGFSMVTGTCRVNICSGRGNTEVTDLTNDQGHRQPLVSQDDEYEFLKPLCSPIFSGCPLVKEERCKLLPEM